MSRFGTMLGILSIVLMVTFLVAGAALKVIAKKKKKVNLGVSISFSIIGCFALVWFIYFRYAGDINNLIMFKDSSDNDLRSIYYSKVLLLDLCPFAYVLLSFFMIFDYKRKYINVVAIWAVIGSMITIFGSIWTVDFPMDKWYNYVFIKSNEGELYFWIHIFMLTFGSFVISYTKRIRFWRFISMHLFVSIYLCYVITIVRTLNVSRNATGLVEFDWINPYGEYNTVYNFFKIPYIDIVFLSYFLVWVGLIIIISLKNLFSSPEKRAFFPNSVYVKFKFIGIISHRIYRIKYKLWKRSLIGFN